MGTLNSMDYIEVNAYGLPISCKSDVLLTVVGCGYILQLILEQLKPIVIKYFIVGVTYNYWSN